MDDYNDGMADFATGMGAFFAFLIIFFAVMALFVVAVYVFTSIAYMKMYQKSGHPKPWGAWVPFYREFLLMEHGGVSGWYYLICYGATILLSGIGTVITATAPLGALSSVGMSGEFDSNAGGAMTGFMVIGYLFSMLSYVPSIAMVVLQIFVIINLNRAFSRPGAGMIVLGILVPIVWLGILAWGKNSVWRPEGAIHGTRGIFFPRQGTTYLERQIAARFGGVMPAHAQKQPKAQPVPQAAYAQQAGYPQQQQQQPGYPAQPQQYSAPQQAPGYPQQPYQQQAPAQQPYQQQAPYQQPQQPYTQQPPVQPQAPVYPAPQQDPAAQAPAKPQAQAQAQPTVQPSAPQAPVDPAEGDKQQ